MVLIVVSERPRNTEDNGSLFQVSNIRSSKGNSSHCWEGSALCFHDMVAKDIARMISQWFKCSALSLSWLIEAAWLLSVGLLSDKCPQKPRRNEEGFFMCLRITPRQAQHSSLPFQTSLDLRLSTSDKCCVFILLVFRQMCFVDEASLPHPICFNKLCCAWVSGGHHRSMLYSVPQEAAAAVPLHNMAGFVIVKMAVFN